MFLLSNWAEDKSISIGAEWKRGERGLNFPSEKKEKLFALQIFEFTSNSPADRHRWVGRN